MSKFMRKGLRLFVVATTSAIFGILTSIGVSAEVGETFTVNTLEGAPITYRVTSDAFSEVEVADCPQDYHGAVTLPEKVEYLDQEYSVTSIDEYSFGEMWFYNRKKYPLVTSVTIPNSVTNIEERAFEGCRSLTSVIIPDSVTSVGASAFSHCNSLTSITIPDSVTNIDRWTFFDCSSLTSVTIPDNVTSIGYHAFSYCSSLTNVTIPDSVTNIEEGAFYNTGLSTIVIPDSVTIIGKYAFACTDLTKVTCYLIEPINIDDTVFSGCSSIIEVDIPDEASKDAYINAGWLSDNIELS